MSTKIVKDDIDRFFDYGIDLTSKTLYMGSMDNDWDDHESGVDHVMARNVIQGLLVLDRIKKDEPLTIIMNNPGGDFYHGMSIFDAIKACDSHVKIIVRGYAMSMGSIILQAADERIMSPNSRMMIHYGQAGMSGSHKNFEKWADEFKRLAVEMEDLYLEKIRQVKPNFTRTKLKKMLDPDTILNPKEALELGLADSIEGEDNE